MIQLLEGLKPHKFSRTDVCKVVKIQTLLTETDAAILKEAIDDHVNWPSLTLEKALAERKIYMSDDTIRKHRLNFCVCERKV